MRTPPLPDVFTGSELHDAPLVAAFGRIKEYLFDTGIITKVCILDEPGRFVGCTLGVFCLDQHHETVLKNDFLLLPRFLQVLPAFSHAGQVKTFEVLEDLIFHVC